MDFDFSWPLDILLSPTPIVLHVISSFLFPNDLIALFLNEFGFNSNDFFLDFGSVQIGGPLDSRCYMR